RAARRPGGLRRLAGRRRQLAGGRSGGRRADGRDGPQAGRGGVLLAVDRRPDGRPLRVADAVPLNGEAPIRVGIVPHTHWDRAWQVPFQAGRVRLVRLLDSLLDELESGHLAHFWLDGQTAAVDDYLA